MTYLLIIDMQEDYVGKKRNRNRYPYDAEVLIDRINERIASYPAEAVIYITNKFFWEFGNKPKKMVDGLNIVSDNVYEKRKGSAFSNERLLEYLQKMNAKSLELVGVDGSYCVGSSALDGAGKGFSIICNLSCIGVKDTEKFENIKQVLTKIGIQFV